MIKVMSIFGTRPEATKMGPLIREMQGDPGIRSVVCVTAQHRELLDQMLAIFGIAPDYDLDIMQAGQSLAQIAVRALEGLDRVMAEVNPDLVLVHGDTATTFVGSLAAYYHKIKLGHVEAGLRTYDKFQPYPEEMNRQLADVLADLRFAPTALSKENLLKEGKDPHTIFVTGNTAVDCLKYTVLENYKFRCGALNRVGYGGGRVLAMTAHRSENLGLPLENICRAVRRVVDDHPDVTLVWPVHPNPRVQETAHAILDDHPRICLTDAVDMNDLHNLIQRSYLVLTDSGGIQEEAPGLRKPVVVLRNTTERPEGVATGSLVLAGTQEQGVYEQTDRLLRDESAYKKMAAAKNPFGDGHAAARIVKAIRFAFGLDEERPAEFD